MKPYLDLLQRVLDEGVERPDRTGVGTIADFGHQMRFRLSDGFPLLTTKKLHVRSIFHELLWFLRGETNVESLQAHGVSIWDEWADEAGELGPIYGKQWRAWGGPDGQSIDQIQQLLELIRREPHSRRQIVSAWNVAELAQMKLAPCHCLFQTAVIDNRLHLQLYQRSCDVFLGVPFNIASYALLQTLLAHQCGLEVGDFVWTGGDVHLYRNHLDQARLQLTRTPFALPRLRITQDRAALEDYQFEDFVLEDYQAHPHIRAEVAV